ncbi:MAG TPA: hypothetical protein VJR89_33230 [Polyangiales bacterium]|nr:hypothetical protein [Polyangiales bacterium]
MLDVLIAAAHPSELEGLHAVLGAGLQKRVRGLRVAARAVGVGMPAAAVGTLQVLRDTQARALVLLGSCGVYGHGLLLTAAVPDRLQLVDAAVIAGQAAIPDAMQATARAHRGLSAGLAKAAGKALRGTCATTCGITTSDGLARRLARAGAGAVENLEGVAVAMACERERVPFAAVLVVTNVVGRKGRRQWLENRVAAAERGAEILASWLDAGAPGIPA